MSIEQLAALPAVATEEQVWGEHRLRLNAYAGGLDVPDALVTSVRGVLALADRVLVMKAPDGQHLMPGGRREPGEGYFDTLRREMREETGWEVEVGDMLGVLHFRHLTPKPEGHAYPYPDFLHLVYACTAARKVGVGDGEWDVPVGFSALEDLPRQELGSVQMWFGRALLERG